MTQRDSLIATVDIVLITPQEGVLKTVVMKRDKDPFKNTYALPGGFFHLDEDEDALASARRVLKDKLDLENMFLEQLFTVSGRTRDPRGWSLSVVFLGIFPEGTLTDLPKDAVLTDIHHPLDLGFDHNSILEKAAGRIKGKGAYSTLPALLIQEPFGLGQLQSAYEMALGHKLDASAFRRKIAALDLLAPHNEVRRGTKGRPSTLWTIKDKGATFDGRSIRPIS